MGHPVEHMEPGGRAAGDDCRLSNELAPGDDAGFELICEVADTPVHTRLLLDEAAVRRTIDVFGPAVKPASG
jgi:hypothetical protein